MNDQRKNDLLSDTKIVNEERIKKNKSKRDATSGDDMRRQQSNELQPFR